MNTLAAIVNELKGPHCKKMKGTTYPHDLGLELDKHDLNYHKISLAAQELTPDQINKFPELRQLRRFGRAFLKLEKTGLLEKEENKIAVINHQDIVGFTNRLLKRLDPVHIVIENHSELWIRAGLLDFPAEVAFKIILICYLIAQLPSSLLLNTPLLQDEFDILLNPTTCSPSHPDEIQNDKTKNASTLPKDSSSTGASVKDRCIELKKIGNEDPSTHISPGMSS